MGDYQAVCLEKHYPHSLTNYLRTYYTFANISSFLYSNGLIGLAVGLTLAMGSVVMTIL
jgi:hypothetical protein